LLSILRQAGNETFGTCNIFPCAARWCSDPATAELATKSAELHWLCYDLGGVARDSFITAENPLFSGPVADWVRFGMTGG
jgi:hypothetical protein